MKNIEKIRRDMSTMELARIFTRAVADGCPPECDGDCCWAKWLMKEVET